jgi:hypothetical protein
VPTSECGDAIATPDEACDKDDLAEQSCADFGFQEGALLCGPDCTLITEGCHTCGDGMMAVSEPCDGVLLGGETCLTQGFGGGTLACSADCTALDTSACTPLASCGNGSVDGTEQCDGADLAGSSCQTLGFDFGVLSCTPAACTFDTDGCDYNDCAGNGEFCLFDPDDPQGNCCPAGVGGNVLGICAFVVCQ